MKFIKLLTAAYVGGVLRHPHEGVLHVTNEDAKRVLDNKAAEDVSADFSAEDSDEAPTDTVSAAITPAGDDPSKQTGRKAASSKE